MADWQRYTATDPPPANGQLERRLTTIEITLSNQADHLETLTNIVERIRGTALYTVMSIAGSAILILVNLLLSKSTG